MWQPLLALLKSKKLSSQLEQRLAHKPVILLIVRMQILVLQLNFFKITGKNVPLLLG